MKKIKKVWGEEHIIENNDLYAGKFLHLKKGYQCSVHYHKIKDETFYVLAGVVCLEYGSETKMKRKKMKKGDIMRIYPEMLHRFTGVKNSILLEISTHDEGSDSYRLTESRKL